MSPGYRMSGITFGIERHVSRNFAGSSVRTVTCFSEARSVIGSMGFRRCSATGLPLATSAGNCLRLPTRFRRLADTRLLYMSIDAFGR
jgi:hypothetical protein